MDKQLMRSKLGEYADKEGYHLSSQEMDDVITAIGIVADNLLRMQEILKPVLERLESEAKNESN